MNNTEKQVENPNLPLIDNKSEDDGYLEPREIVGFKKGTNPLLWNAPIYSAVGDLTKESSENPNEYWNKWALTQEKNNYGS